MIEERGKFKRPELVAFLRSPSAIAVLLEAARAGKAPAFAISAELHRRFGISRTAPVETLDMLRKTLDVAMVIEDFEPSGMIVTSATDPIFAEANTYKPIEPFFTEEGEFNASHGMGR